MLPYNDLAAVEAAFATDGADIACIIVEPIAGNMNLIMPRPGFLQGLRAVCDQHGAVLIFDEVMTGFRVHPRGAQGLYGITPDLTTLGKVIGGGMPVGAFGGKRDDHGEDRAARTGLSGGNAFGQPARGRGGARDAEGNPGPGLLRGAIRTTRRR